MDTSKYQFVYQEFDMLREYNNNPTIHEKPEKVVMSQSRVASFPIRMQEARIRKRITVHDLSLKCGIPIKEITSYESGAEVPNSAIVEKIEQILEIS